ncbi:MAG: hypothetical protein ACR2KG_04720 [Nocardioidaceae bacterium]
MISRRGTALTFDIATSTGTVVLDDGAVLYFSRRAFEAGGLRLLRPGQRVRLRMSERDEVELITIATLGDPR